MQSMFLIVIMVLASIFMTSEMSRNNTELDATLKGQSIAANILQYHDLVLQYMLHNYPTLHLDFAVSPDNVEQIKPVEYIADGINNYSQKNLSLFLNYHSVIFNYAQLAAGESEISPMLYIATSFDTYTASAFKLYTKIKLPEVMGYLGENLARHVYQGNSSYWIVPWILSQDNCNVKEIYSQIPDDVNGALTVVQVQRLFNLFCSQIQNKSRYRFLTYVYIQPVANPANI